MSGAGRGARVRVLQLHDPPLFGPATAEERVGLRSESGERAVPQVLKTGVVKFQLSDDKRARALPPDHAGARAAPTANLHDATGHTDRRHVPVLRNMFPHPTP